MVKFVLRIVCCVVMPLMLASACAQVNVPDPRTTDVPTVTPPLDRYKGVNERRDAVTRIKLGRDVLVPHVAGQDPLPNDVVGPYELRGETLASALQLILDDYDVSLAFETDAALTTRITVANLRGPVSKVVNRVCELANLYCRHEDGVVTVKEVETFVVDLPPLSETSSSSGGGSDSSSDSSSSSSSSSDSGSSDSVYDDIVEGLGAIIGGTPTVDSTTRVMIYTASQRANKYAKQYFERLRKNTALIVYETHIWEVTLNNSNRTGIDWTSLINNIGNIDLDVTIPGGAPAVTGGATPISITPTYDGSADVTAEMVLEFISEQGTVKTVSQPQLTVLSGSSASLAVEQSQNFVSGVTRTPSTTPGVPDAVSLTTDTVQTGLSMDVTSSWDQSTVYGNIAINLEELLDIDVFQPDANTTIQLPQTTSRNISTQIRVRPGDAVLIAGLVTERDDFSGSGPGLLKPFLNTSRAASVRNTELIFLLRPRVIVFDIGDDTDTVGIVDAPKVVQPPATSAAKAIPMKVAPVVPEPAAMSDDDAADVGRIFDAPVSQEPMPEPVAPPPANQPVALTPQNAAPESAGEEDLLQGLSPNALAPAPAEPVVMPQQQQAPAVQPSTQPARQGAGGLNLPSWLPSQSTQEQGGAQ